MKPLFLNIVLLFVGIGAWAQREENFWPAAAGLDFNNGAPVLTAHRFGMMAEGGASVCDTSGQLLFYTNGYWIWDRNHQLMPALTGGVPGYNNPRTPDIGYPPLMPYTGGIYPQPAVIIPAPGNPGKYYVFTLGGASGFGVLTYHMVDMSLNNGMGDIIPNKRRLVLEGSLTEKMTVVKGCNSVWVIVRSNKANRYLAYEITDTGVNTGPVISECGLLEQSNYMSGVIKFSPDGRKMIAACHRIPTNRGGLELYDFDPFSGKLSNPIILDSSIGYYGACFSHENSKVYATAAYKIPGEVYQFDLSLTTPAAMQVSRILVLTNPTWWYYVFPLGWIPYTNYLGDMKRGPDHKIYVGDNCASAQEKLWTAPGSGIRAPLGYHAINFPERVGLACMPQTSAVTFGLTQHGLPNDVVKAPSQDTVSGIIKVPACFQDSIWLQADAGKRYVWNNGSLESGQMVYGSGNYVVCYTDLNCHYHIDTFSVTFNRHLPEWGVTAYSCPGARQGTISMMPYKNDTTVFTYQWQDEAGTVLRLRQSSRGDTLAGLNPGKYAVRIITPAGCDTMLYTEVLSLPQPVASFDADTIVCKGDSVMFRNNSDAPLWEWHFGDGNVSRLKDPVYLYRNTGRYITSLVVENIERCRDTATKSIQITALYLQLVSGKHTADREDRVMLRTEGSEAYRIIAWLPGQLFADQQAYRQQIIADTIRIYTAIGISEYGCIDTAVTTLLVHPLVYLPSAFSPNGDGRNDYFRPVVYGAPVTIRSFHIFDRWGKLVWTGTGSSATIRWDGTYNGIPAETGAYFYYLTGETQTGKTFTQQADVTLVR